MWEEECNGVLEGGVGFVRVGVGAIAWMDKILAREMMAMKVREVENEERSKDV